MNTTKKATKKTKKLVKTLKNINRNTARRNARFEALDKPGKRVYIAKDVLAQLAAKKIVASPGTYLAGKVKLPTIKEEREEYSYDSHGYEKRSVKVVNPDTEVQDIVEKMKTCNACALGTVFVCAVRIADDLKIGDMPIEDEVTDSIEFDGMSMYKYLGQFFSEAQLELIESAFECRVMGDGGEGRRDDANRDAADYGTNFMQPKDRMVAIMKNIIKNKGFFKPESLSRQEDWIGDY